MPAPEFASHVCAAHPKLTGEARNLIDAGESKILLNLAGATQIDSSSISTIVRAFVSLRNRGASLKLLNARGNVKMVLEMLRLLNVTLEHQTCQSPHPT